MKTTKIPVLEVELIAVTRALLGIGIGLLVHDYLSAKGRAPIGWACLAVGLLTTIPLATSVYSSAHE